MTPTVGLAGAGQLARMMFVAALDLDLRVRVLAAEPTDPAARVAADVDFGSPLDAEALTSFATTVDVLTFDHELVDLDAVRTLEAAGATVRPGSAALSVAVDKVEQRRRLGGAGLPVPPWDPIAGPADLDRIAARHGWPLVLKAATGGYDGRGVWVVGDEVAARARLADAEKAGVELLAEPLLALDAELAVLVARRPRGQVVAYPAVATVQVDGICREVLAPAPVDPCLTAEACELALAVAKTVDAVGILAVELFVTDGGLLVNELAARPHNSGHWTIEGAATSQFANHLRAVCDLPLGDVGARAPVTAMVNVLGDEAGTDPTSRLADALAVPGAAIHLYGKAPRPGRKLGHVTALGTDADEVLGRARCAVRLLGGAA